MHRSDKDPHLQKQDRHIRGRASFPVFRNISVCEVGPVPLACKLVWGTARAVLYPPQGRRWPWGARRHPSLRAMRPTLGAPTSTCEGRHLSLGPPSRQKCPHDRRLKPACLPQLVRDLRHDRAVADRKNDGMGLRFRTSAWLTPGLALGWLALLATFAHSISTLLTTWAATVSLVVLLVRWLPEMLPSSRSRATSDPEEGEGSTTDRGRGPNSTTSGTHSPDSASGSSSKAEPTSDENSASSAVDRTVSSAEGRSEHPVVGEVTEALELRVLTAAEVASVLRIDSNLIIAAIDKGEFPGNRIGNHWRVDQGALARWLQGKYGDLAGPPPSPLSAERQADSS